MKRIDESGTIITNQIPPDKRTGVRILVVCVAVLVGVGYLLIFLMPKSGIGIGILMVFAAFLLMAIIPAYAGMRNPLRFN